MCEIAKKALGRVYISLSECIYANLAFEEHIFRNHDVEKHGDVMMVWSNRPTVVVGRHQNPWLEVNFPYLKANSIDFARRHSGGGTVYHDKGNLNISLLTSHKDHCRPRNLNFLADALNRRFTVKITPNKRDDMEMQPGNRKCSGTAARIAKGKAYHHLTLLVDVDVSVLKSSIRSPIKDLLTTNATRSVSAPAVGYLCEEDPTADVSQVRDTVVRAFKDKFEITEVQLVDVDATVEESESVRPVLDELKSWQWRFGKTPKFTVDHDGAQLKVENGIVVESTVSRYLNVNFDDVAEEIYASRLETIAGEDVRNVVVAR